MENVKDISVHLNWEKEIIRKALNKNADLSPSEIFPSSSYLMFNTRQ